MLGKERGLLFPLRDPDKTINAKSVVGDYKKAAKKLLGKEDFAEFRVPNENNVTLVLYNDSTSSDPFTFPGIRLRNNTTFTQESTNRAAYTAKDLGIDTTQQILTPAHTGEIITEEGQVSSWPETHSYPPGDITVSDAEARTFDQLAETINNHTIVEIMNTLAKTTPTDRIDEYGRTEEETKRDEKINEKITIASAAILYFQPTKDGSQHMKAEDSAGNRVMLYRDSENENGDYFPTTTIFIQYPPYQDRQNNYVFLQDQFILRETDIRLFYHRQKLIEFESEEVEDKFISPTKPLFDSLASEEQAQSVLKTLKELTPNLY